MQFLKEQLPFWGDSNNSCVRELETLSREYYFQCKSNNLYVQLLCCNEMLRSHMIGVYLVVPRMGSRKINT